MNDLQQQLASSRLSDGLTDRLLVLLSENVFTLLGLLFICMSAACAVVSIVNTFRSDPEHQSHEEKRKHKRQSQALAHLFGFIFAGGTVYGYLSGESAARIFMTLMLALIAGGAAPFLYDLFWWVRETAAPALGRALLAAIKASAGFMASKGLGWLGSLFKKGGGPEPPDDKPPAP